MHHQTVSPAGELFDGQGYCGSLQTDALGPQAEGIQLRPLQSFLFVCGDKSLTASQCLPVFCAQPECPEATSE